MWSLAELQEAMNRLVETRYSASFFLADNGHVSIHLTKRTYGKAEVDVQGSGDNLSDALNKALSNFPRHPLDGTEWQNNRLASPSPSPIDRKAEELSSL